MKLSDFYDTEGLPESLRRHDANRMLRAIDPAYAGKSALEYRATLAAVWETAFGPCTITHESELTDDIVDKLRRVKQYMYYGYHSQESDTLAGSK